MKVFNKYKKSIVYGLIVLIITSVIPIIMSAGLYIPYMKFSKGDESSWIPFWGSYLGAIIGASVVYFVSRYQINEQNKIQLRSIRDQDKLSMDRQKRSYFQQLKIEKINEIISTFIKLESRTYLLIEYLIPLDGTIGYDSIIYSEEMFKTDENFFEAKKDYYNKSLTIIKRIESFNNEFIIFKSSLTFLKVYIPEIDKELEAVLVELDKLMKMNYKIIDRIEKIYNLERPKDGISNLIDLDQLSILTDKALSAETIAIEVLQEEIRILNTIH